VASLARDALDIQSHIQLYRNGYDQEFSNRDTFIAISRNAILSQTSIRHRLFKEMNTSKHINPQGVVLSNNSPALHWGTCFALDSQ
jgi:predicted nucleotidyltransferase